MGRKPNPKGKDRTRTISLDGDVADIAQQLADKSQLSKVLSQLLRNAYNLSDEVTALKEQLQTMTSERKRMQQAEEELVQAITEAEQRIITERSHLLPQLYQRQGKLESRLADLRLKLNYLPPHETNTVMNQIDETFRLLNTVLEDIKELEE